MRVSRIVDAAEESTPIREAWARTLVRAGAINALSASSETRQQLERYHTKVNVSAYGVKVRCPDTRGESFRIKVVRRCTRILCTVIALPPDR
jgi:hypothetical protein